MRNPSFIIAIVCALLMNFLTDEWWKTVSACLLLAAVHLTTEYFTQKALRPHTERSA